MLGGNALLVSMGFAISFGIFVAAFVMAMFFTPSLTALIGHAAWWPGHGDDPRAARRRTPCASAVRSSDDADSRRAALRPGRSSPAARSRPGGRARTAYDRGRPSRRRGRRPSRRCRCTGRGAGPAPGCPAAAARSSAIARSREFAATPPPIRMSSMPSLTRGVDRLAGEHVADGLLEAGAPRRRPAPAPPTARAPRPSARRRS